MSRRSEPREHVIDAELANGNLDAWKQALGFPRSAVCGETMKTHIGFYETEEEYIARLQARNAALVAALEAILAKDEHGFLITPLDNDLLEQAEKALANQ